MESPNPHTPSPANRLREQLEFGLALSILLGGLWFKGFDIIKNLTLDSPIHRMIEFFAFTHAILFTFFAYSLLLLFDMGLSLLGEGKLPQIAYRVFYYLWPFGLFFIVVSFIIHRIGIASGVLIPAIFVLAIATAIVGRRQKNSLLFASSVTFGIFTGASYLYVFAMAALLSDVHIETDKEFYNLDEPVIVNIRPNGYVSTPTITEIKVDGHGVIDARGPSVTFVCTYREDTWACSEPSISVTYQPNFSFRERQRTHRIRLAFERPK